MIRLLRALIEKNSQIDGETSKVLHFAFDAAKSCGTRVLDIGCGYGRFLRPLRDAGLDATGVEINPEIVAANRTAGLSCMTAAEIEASATTYDVMVIAHVIEHFAPTDLMRLMDNYLDRLKTGGRLIIATPLASDYFYDDFDHIKPYQPTGILMVFGAGAAQVQYYARNRLALRDLWFRRAPLRITHARGRYLRSPLRYILICLDLLSAAAFLLSGRLIGRADGWVGVFEKIDRPQ
jgi:SAM-dependent methyltransferase